MKNNKYIVIFLKSDGTEDKSKEYKSFKEIENELGLNYHDVREIHKITNNKINKKFLHDNLKLLSQKIQIKSIIKDIMPPKEIKV